MPRDFPRTRRVGEQLQRDLADLIRSEVKDPRLGMVSISAVNVTRDLGHAKVYVTVLGDDASDSIDVLNSAAGYLRGLLGKRMRTRTVPALQFIHDRSLEEGARIGALINRAVASDKGGDE